MKRALVAFAAALAMGLVVPGLAVGPASAQAKAKAKVTKVAKGQKVCRSKQPTGAIKTWTCGQDQPCCVNHSFNLYTCGSQLLRCF